METDGNSPIPPDPGGSEYGGGPDALLEWLHGLRSGPLPPLYAEDLGDVGGASASWAGPDTVDRDAVLAALAAVLIVAAGLVAIAAGIVAGPAAAGWVVLAAPLALCGGLAFGRLAAR